MALIVLRNRKGDVVGHALVDDADYDWLNQWRWCLGNRRTHGAYVVRSEQAGGRNGKKVTVRMHRLILGLAPGDPREGDHINLNKLDNRRSNLRIATRAENARNQPLRKSNTSGYRGVYREDNRWSARGFMGGKAIRLGRFDTAEEAGRVAEAWRAVHYG
jgi:hypothetical protein